MILVLDACTISNLIHAFQDTSLIRDLNKCFSEVCVSHEVVEEVNNNKNPYLHLYNDQDELDQLYSDIRLIDFIPPCDKDKRECKDFLRRFSITKQLHCKSNGEYYCSLLSLHISRDGVNDLNENLNKVLFATDDIRAEKLYNDLFRTNQIGKIIDSVDIIIIYYLKGLITKNRAIQFLNSLICIYNKIISDLRYEIKRKKNNVKTDQKHQILFTEFIEKIENCDFNEIARMIEDPGKKRILSHYPKIYELLLLLVQDQTSKKIARLKTMREDLHNDLIWKL